MHWSYERFSWMLAIVGGIVLLGGIAITNHASSDLVLEFGGAPVPTDTRFAALPNASAAPPTTPAWDAATVFREIDRSFGELSHGTAIFNVPSDMRVGEPRHVIARIGRIGDAREILKNLPPGVTEEWEQTNITPTMKASLVGAASDFNIASNSAEEQVIGGGYTEWNWLVTPLDSGDKELTLYIVAVLRVAGYEKPRNVVVTTRRVRVHVNPRVWFRTFIEAHWGTALAFVLGGIFVGAWKGVLTLVRGWRERKRAARS